MGVAGRREDDKIGRGQALANLPEEAAPRFLGGRNETYLCDGAPVALSFSLTRWPFRSSSGRAIRPNHGIM